MLIEVHMLQNHCPANMNRDDLGAPKTCYFGGVLRDRISSQCLKRSIRRSDEFRMCLEHDRGVRTRMLIHEIASRARADASLTQRIKEVFVKGGLQVKEIEGHDNGTEILWFVPDSAINDMARAAKDSTNTAELGKKFARILAHKATVPDIALAGRMTEFDGKQHFKGLNSKLRVEAALSAGHAISTHAAQIEVDYFTAADDLAREQGAGHVNEAMFTSACFYKYFCIDWNQLNQNLEHNIELSILTVRSFLCAAALATPSGKKNAFAPYNPPEGILVEIKRERRIPMSYANAFVRPVPTDGTDLVAESVRYLGQYVYDMIRGYGIPADRFWFSPGGRHSLLHVNDSQERPVIEGAHGELDSLADLEETVMAVVSAHQGTQEA